MGQKKLVFGVGVNDADYPVNPRVDGKIVPCPFYTAWVSMLRRCYSEVYQKKQPTYKGCYVVKEWLTFSCFRIWMETQPWVGMQLDKDLLSVGNQCYGPDFCVFISSDLNKFVTERSSMRGDFPIGVSYHKATCKFQAECRVGKGSSKYLGLFDTQEEAHQAWLTEKRKQANILASVQQDPRVSKALIERYENYNEVDY